MNFQEKAIISYRFLFSNVFQENKPGMNFTKNFIYTVVLFLQKSKKMGENENQILKAEYSQELFYNFMARRPTLIPL